MKIENREGWSTLYLKGDGSGTAILETGVGALTTMVHLGTPGEVPALTSKFTAVFERNGKEFCAPFLDYPERQLLREVLNYRAAETRGRVIIPEFPDYEFNPTGPNTADMFDSQKFTLHHVTRGDEGALSDDSLRQAPVLAARAYFAQTRPAWHGAQAGELWSVKIEGRDWREAFVTASRGSEVVELAFAFASGVKSLITSEHVEDATFVRAAE